MPVYRVRFLHVRHGTEFVVDIQAPTAEEAEAVAARILTRDLKKRAGRITDWRYGDTVEQSA